MSPNITLPQCCSSSLTRYHTIIAHCYHLLLTEVYNLWSSQMLVKPQPSDGQAGLQTCCPTE